MNDTQNNELCPCCGVECFDNFMAEQGVTTDEFDGFDGFANFSLAGVCPFCCEEIVVSFETTDYAIVEDSISIERASEVQND
jgi:hypothetical protein